MNVKYYVKTLLASFNPKSYRNLTNRKLKEAFNFFFLTVVLSLILFFILYIPYIFIFSNNFTEKFDQISVFKLDTEVEHTQPVQLASTPLIILDLNQENFTKGDILITKNHIYYKKYAWFGEESIDLNQLADLKLHQQKTQSLLITLMVFLLPAILALLFIAFTLKNIILAFVLTFISYIIYRITLHHVKFISLFKAAIYATSIMLILDTILILFFPILWAPFILYIILFIFASWWLAQKRFSIKKRKPQEFPEKKDEANI